MRIYFSGIGGVGIGPLAQIALDARSAGDEVVGSDRESSPTVEALTRRGVVVHIGEQTGEFLRAQHARQAFDYFVYTAALPDTHPELLAAHELGIMCLKRDGLLARIIDEKQLQMIACAGTHGKTTTTALLVWTLKQLGIPVSYSIGTTVSFGPSGEYTPGSTYFVYECDEYDRNFLHYTPELSLISSIDYDHPDTYPTPEDYWQAFTSFIDQSASTLMWERDYQQLGQPRVSSDLKTFDDTTHVEHIHLPGLHMRQNAFLVERAVRQLFPDVSYHAIVSAINAFPGVGRRMEKVADNLYSDYGHHPSEIKATLQLARELSDHVVLVYQPHQNVRQHEIWHEYTPDIFADAETVYWLPTYLSRENPELAVLTPEQLSRHIADKVHIAQPDDTLWQMIDEARHAGKLVLAMGAGDIDAWLRSQLG